MYARPSNGSPGAGSDAVRRPGGRTRDSRGGGGGRQAEGKFDKRIIITAMMDIKYGEVPRPAPPPPLRHTQSESRRQGGRRDEAREAGG